MNIPKEHIKLLRKDIELVTQRLHRLGNILILAEKDELTEQCGVNTSNSFNTPPPRPAFLERDIKNVSEGVLHPSDMKLGEDWTVYTLKFKCNDCDTEWSFLSEIPSDNYECTNPPCGQIVASYHSESHSLNTLKKEKQEFFEDFGDEDEDEPREANPVEVLFDYISEAFTDEHSLTRPANYTKNWYPDGMDQLCAPSHLRNLMVRAQDFLDADTSLRERVKELEKELEGREISVAMLKELAKRYRDELDTMCKNKTD